VSRDAFRWEIWKGYLNSARNAKVRERNNIHTADRRKEETRKIEKPDRKPTCAHLKKKGLKKEKEKYLKHGKQFRGKRTFATTAAPFSFPWALVISNAVKRRPIEGGCAAVAPCQAFK